MRNRLIALAIPAVVLAACSADGGDDDPGAESGDVVVADHEDEESDEPAVDEPADVVPSDDAQAAEEAEWADNHRQAEEHIAECMAAQGFDFEPRPWQMGAPHDDLRAGLGEEEFRELYGYGIATPIEEFEEPDDANQLNLAQMPPEEREAFDLALHGEYFLNPETGFLEFGGCFAEAQEAVYGESNEAWEELSTHIEDLDARFDSDSRMVEARHAWGVCMAENGDDFDDEGAAQTYVYDRLHEITEPTDDGLLHRDPSELEQLQADELRIAAADADCAEEHLGQLQEWRTEIEREWVGEHEDLLDETVGDG